MPAPSTSNGIERAISEIAVPSIFLVVTVAIVREMYGGQEAGLVYLGLSILILSGIYFAAKYWNIRYTVGFVVAGVTAVYVVPGAMPHLIPPRFSSLGNVVVLVFLGLIGMRLFDKL